ncbi:UNKNOWN [Stylonychia lemnae]|uniref:PH domain-containing protein n=1 Tax=Stylonychia lemnae TaxID=5949 RepID=A0A078A9G7_STYLE|nr:UNKNOWN [Stylonychia lemnae]|eukprot:CDW78900.1 UNKNOWN [Stylonychia lemnae]
MGNCQCDRANKEDFETYAQTSRLQQHPDYYKNFKEQQNDDDDLDFQMSELNAIHNTTDSLANNTYHPAVPLKISNIPKIMRMDASELEYSRDLTQGTASILRNSYTPLNSNFLSSGQPLEVMQQDIDNKNLSFRDMCPMMVDYNQSQQHLQNSERTIVNFQNSSYKGVINTIDESKFISAFDYRKIEILNQKYDPILFQGELLKLKPGVKFEFQPRWIQITGKALRYYKNRWTKNNSLQKPLGAVPIKALHSIKVLEKDITKIHASCEKKCQYNFEIVLKQDFLDLYLDPYYDIVSSSDKNKLIISTENRKLELSRFQDQDVDYYSDPIRKEVVIQNYLNETQETKSTSNSQMLILNEDQPYNQGIMIGEENIFSTATHHHRVSSIPLQDITMQNSSKKSISIYHSLSTTPEKKKKQTKILMSDREEQFFLIDKRLIFATENKKDFQQWLEGLSDLIKIFRQEEMQ